MNTKGDLINSAYSKLRISGLTVDPETEEISLALITLENMMSELELGRNICMNFNFEASPDLASPSNVPAAFFNMIQCNLAVRLSIDFGSQPTPVLVAQATQSLSTASGVSAAKLVLPTAQPSRQPLGSGTTLRRTTWARFNRQADIAPPDCETHDLVVGNIDDYQAYFSAYLGDETIASYTISADSGMTIITSSNESPVIMFRVQAVPTSQTTMLWNQLRIVITTSTGRVETRLINFNIVPRVLVDGSLTN